MLLLRPGDRFVEEPRLRVVIIEGFRSCANRGAFNWPRGSVKSAVYRFSRGVRVEGIRLVSDAALLQAHLMNSITLQIVERTFGRIHRQLMEIRPTQPAQLCIEIGKQPTLQQGIFGEIEARHEVARAESNLLGFGEKIVGIAVEDHFPNHLQRYKFLGNNLGGIEHVEFKFIRSRLIKNLQTEFPFREIAGVDRFPQILAMEIGVGAVDFYRFIPQYRTVAQFRAPVPFDKTRLASFTRRKV